MSPTDVPQVPSQHASTIIGNHWPQTSETGTAASVIELYKKAAESVGTADTAETMHALIEANATGVTPTKLVAEFSTQQRQAFDRALQQLNMGQGASVMAQDILNTKVQLNGTVVSFEAAVQQLLAAAAAAPQTPKTQEEFEKRYNELLDEAKNQAKQLGQNHRLTQDALVSSIQQGATPEVPSTMAPTSPEAPTVPGMPDNAMGSLLQNVAGQMMKPQNMGMPNLGQLGQSVAPLAQSAQAAIGQLMSSLGGAGGLGEGAGAGDDALSVLTKGSGVGEQDATLGQPTSGAAGGVGAGSVGQSAGSGGSGSGRTASSEASEGEAEDDKALAAEAPEAKTTLSAAPAENATLSSPGQNMTVAAPATTPLAAESVATAPPVTAATAAPVTVVPTTTLSAGDAATAADPLSSARTHTAAGDVTVGSAALTPGSPATAAAGAAGAAPMPMMPMMPPMGGGLGGGSHNGSAPPARAAAAEVARKDYQPERPEPSAELTDFGSGLKGLEHGTDMELVASSILAALFRTHDRAGINTQVAVGVNMTTAVFVTSDGLGFLPPGIRAAGHLTPLITQVPNDFIARWLGCEQPWRPLLEAAAVGLVGPFDTVVTTDADAAAFGVLALTQEQIEAVNISAGSKDRWFFDAVDPQDVRGAQQYLESLWGRPLSPAADLEDRAWQARWSGADGPGLYPRRWARYLIAAAAADVAAGDIDDARYALRCALRIPHTDQEVPS